MTELEKAARMALEVMETLNHEDSVLSGEFEKEVTALRQALEQQPAEPVIDKSAAKRIATALGWEPKRKPLTDEEIEACLHHVDENGIGLFAFARAIEAAHGIKEKNK